MTDTTLQFRIQAVPTLLMVILTPLFCGLGLWQLDRAEQKRNIANLLEMRRKLPALSLGDNLPDVRELEFRKVSAQGRFLTDKTVLIENRKHQGKNGFHVVTPFQLTDNGRIILVNRGWVPRQNNQPLFDTPSGVLTIEGEASIPEPPALQLNQASSDNTEPPHWPFLTLDHYIDWSGLDVLPFVILQSPGDAGGFVRQWPRPQSNDAMHTGYAIQWFAFGLITLTIWLRLSLRKHPARSQS